MARGKRISDEVRAQVIAALLQGQGVTKVAEDLGVPQPTVSRIKKAIPRPSLDKVESKKRESLENLLINYVCEGLETLTAQLQEVRRPEYVQKQDAASLATLHGVISDKLTRILSAFEPAREE